MVPSVSPPLKFNHWGYGWRMRCHYFSFSLKYILSFEPSNAHLCEFFISCMIGRSYFPIVFKCVIKVCSVFDTEGFGLEFHLFKFLIFCLDYLLDSFWNYSFWCLRGFYKNLGWLPSVVVVSLMPSIFSLRIILGINIFHTLGTILLFRLFYVRAFISFVQ